MSTNCTKWFNGSGDSLRLVFQLLYIAFSDSSDKLIDLRLLRVIAGLQC